MKLNLIKLESQFKRLTADEQSSIKGGWAITDQQLQLIFDYDDVGGFTGGLAVKFNTAIKELSSTDVGASMLQSYLLLNGGQKICLTSFKSTGGALASFNTGAWEKDGFHHAANSMDIGNLVDYQTNNQGHKGLMFYAASHEMYHAFQKNFWKMENLTNSSSAASVTIEIDAYLFAGKAAKQYDKKQWGTTDYYGNGGVGKFVGNDCTSQTFRTAWNTLISSEQGFTLANYNALIADFATSGFNDKDDNTKGFQDSTLYSSMSCNPITEAEQDKILINDLLYNSSKQLVVPPVHVLPGSSTPSGGTNAVVPGFYYDPNTDDYSFYYSPDWESGSSANDSYTWDNFYNEFNTWYGFDSTTAGSSYGTFEQGGTVSTTGSTYGHSNVNDTGYVLEYYNHDTNATQFVNPGEAPGANLTFVQSQDPNNPGGYDSDGYDPNNCDIDGYGRDGRDSSGYDREGYDPDGYNQDGVDQDGYDRDGYDSEGYDSEGYDSDGYDDSGYGREDYAC